MKKLLLALILILGVSAVPMAQTPDTTMSSVAYFGGMYESSFYGVFGVGKKVSGGLWTFGSYTAGTNHSLGAEAVYFVHPSSVVPQVPTNIYVGLVAGLNSDWVNDVGDGQPAIYYVTGAAGGIVSYQFNNYGLWGYAKYMQELQESDYSNAWRFGAGIHFMF